jgi:hypothetical protein
MSRWILPLIGFAVITSLLTYLYLQQQRSAGSEAPVGPSVTGTGESGVVFADAGGGYRLHVPPGWSLSDNSRADQLIRADLTKGSDTGVQIRLEALGGSGFESFAREYTGKFERDMRGHWGGTIRELERRDAELGGNDCYIVSLQADRPNGEAWFLKEYLISHGNRVVALQCGTKMGERLLYEPVFDGIAGSLEFIIE